MYLPRSQSYLSCQKVSLLVAINLLISLLHRGIHVGEQDEEITDLETLLRQEREREKTRRQEDVDIEVSQKPTV